MVSKVETTYSDGAGKSATLEISDSGGMSGLVGLAGWVGMQEEREDSSGSERTAKVNGRITHEKVSKSGGTNEFSVVLGDRFIVTATGRQIDLADLKTALAGLDLAARELVELGVDKVAKHLALGLQLFRRARVLDAATVQDDHVIA